MQSDTLNHRSFLLLMIPPSFRILASKEWNHGSPADPDGVSERLFLRSLRPSFRYLERYHLRRRWCHPHEESNVSWRESLLSGEMRRSSSSSLCFSGPSLLETVKNKSNAWRHEGKILLLLLSEFSLQTLDEHDDGFFQDHQAFRWWWFLHRTTGLVIMISILPKLSSHYGPLCHWIHNQ